MGERLEGYVSVQEAAEAMKRSTEQVRRYLREGKLTGRRIGGQWFIRETAVVYRTREVGEAEMGARDWRPGEGLDAAAYGRLAIFDRVNGRREAIRRRWEGLGVRVDAADLIRELREEEP